MSGKIFVTEIWAKIPLANQIAGFVDQPYLQNILKQPDLWLFDTISHKLKVDLNFFGWT